MDTYNALIFRLYEAAQECTPAEFGDHALAQLKQAVHFDSAVLLNMDVSPGRQIAVHSMHLSNQPPEQLMAWGELETPDHVLDEAMRRRGASLVRGSQDTFGAQADFMDYCRRYEIAHTLIHIPKAHKSMPDNVDVLSLWRARPEHDYTERERALSDLLLPHLFQANLINLRLFAGLEASPTATVSALANLMGCMYFSPPDAIALLQREWPEWIPPFLPGELLQQLASSEHRQYAGAHVLVKAELLGQALHLQIAPRPRIRLTDAEWSVARLAADGMTYKEIARALGNSPATVRNQLHSVYNKMGVDNKTQLSATLATIVTA